jgi:hypothetical protein
VTIEAPFHENRADVRFKERQLLRCDGTVFTGGDSVRRPNQNNDDHTEITEHFAAAYRGPKMNEEENRPPQFRPAHRSLQGPINM